MNKISKGTINKVVDSGQEGEVVSLGCAIARVPNLVREEIPATLSSDRTTPVQ
jgi:hypothetical protein